MLNEEILKFISYYTGNDWDTIRNIYDNYLIIKDEEDFTEFHPSAQLTEKPNHSKQTP